MTKSYFGSSISQLIEKEAQAQKAFEQIEKVLLNYSHHHRDPDAYNRSFVAGR